LAKNNSRRIIVPLLVSKDVMVVSAAWIGAYFLRHHAAGRVFFRKDINPIDNYLLLLPIIICALLFTNYSFGLYRRHREVSRLQEIQQYIKAFLMAALIVTSISFMAKELDIGRSVVALFVVLIFGLMFIGQVSVRRIESRLRRNGNGNLKAVIIGAGTTGVLAYGKIVANPIIGYDVVGFLDDLPERSDLCLGNGKARVLGGLKDLHSVVEQFAIDEVVIADPSIDHTTMLNFISDNEELGVDFRVVTDLFDVMVTDPRMDLIEELPLIDLPSKSRDFRYELFKRIFDLSVSLTFMLLFGWLLWPLVILAIKLDSRGPVHFSQNRVGRFEKDFTMLKFRTMHVDADAYSYSPNDADDPRITRVGKFLRKTSLDELPQLINIIKGEMSIVGPRPEMPFIVEKYESWQRRRFDVLPGLTGLWQIYGRKDLPLDENIQYDFFYLKHRSFLFDLSILLRTFPAVIFSKGAY
jgi:exopolysaccharide biosynthesis polyprenyl glycosylphosphotransferase